MIESFSGRGDDARGSIARREQKADEDRQNNGGHDRSHHDRADRDDESSLAVFFTRNDESTRSRSTRDAIQIRRYRAALPAPAEVAASLTLETLTGDPLFG